MWTGRDLFCPDGHINLPPVVVIFLRQSDDLGALRGVFMILKKARTAALRSLHSVSSIPLESTIADKLNSDWPDLYKY
jgi:hypothetical protein